jgi:hypothetical protein
MAPSMRAEIAITTITWMTWGKYKELIDGLEG